MAELHALRALALPVLLLAACAGRISDPRDEGERAGTARPDIADPGEKIDATDVPRVWRLSNSQYARTVDALLGGGGEIARSFLPEVGGHGFPNSVDHDAIGNERALEYQRAAQTLAEAMVGDEARLARVWPCDVGYLDDVCVRDFVSSFVGSAFRRPLLAEEQSAYEALFVETRDELDGPTAVRLVIETVLQSPSFLYRTEIGPLDAAEPLPGELVDLTPHERASMLAYVLWGAPPNDELLASVDDLGDEAGLRAAAARAAEDSRTVESLEEFVHGLVDYEHLDHASPAAGHEDDWDLLRASMKRESERFVEHLLVSGEVAPTFEHLLTARYNFVDSRLAVIYGVPGPDEGFVRVEPPNVRPGLLGHAGVLAAHALPDGTSPPRRGKLILERFLCMSVPAPPDDVETPDGLEDTVTTTREFFEAATGPGTCGAGCHTLLNPAGFAFEHYDQVGRWRDTDNGAPVDSRVDLSALGLGTVAGAAELAQELAGSETALDCFARQLYRFAMGRVENAGDEALVRDLGAAFRASGGDIRALFVDLVSHEGMHRRRMPSPAE